MPRAGVLHYFYILHSLNFSKGEGSWKGGKKKKKRGQSWRRERGLYNNITPAMPQGHEHLALEVLYYNPKELAMALKTVTERNQLG